MMGRWSFAILIPSPPLQQDGQSCVQFPNQLGVLSPVHAIHRAGCLLAPLRIYLCIRYGYISTANPFHTPGQVRSPRVTASALGDIGRHALVCACVQQLALPPSTPPQLTPPTQHATEARTVIPHLAPATSIASNAASASSSLTTMASTTEDGSRLQCLHIILIHTHTHTHTQVYSPSSICRMNSTTVLHRFNVDGHAGTQGRAGVCVKPARTHPRKTARHA
jgi:hypothetical protein